MMPRIDTRIYTNLVLTVIATVLVAGAVREYGMGLVPTAQAQIVRNTQDDLSVSATGVPIDTNIPQTQDVAVAAATSQVAASNREIAVALHEIAVAIRDGMGDLKTSLRNANGADAVGVAPAPAARPSGAKPTVEVR